MAEIWNLRVLPSDIFLTAILELQWSSWIFFKSPYLRCLKSYRAEICNLYLLTNLLLGAILELWHFSWIFKRPYLSSFKSIRALI